MEEGPPRRAADKKSPLVEEIERILCDAMGIRALLLPIAAVRGPLAGALALLIGYAAVWAIVEFYAAAGGWESDPRLVTLLAWGGSYFAAAYFVARSATLKIVETVRLDIDPHASRTYLDRVRNDLAARRKWPTRLGLPAIIALICLAAGAWAIEADVESISLSRGTLASPESLFWAVSYFIYLFTAVQAILAARFYLSFADHLEMEKRSFYVLAAAESPLVVGLAKLSSEVLAFWLMIFLIVLTSMLLAMPWLGAYALPSQSLFLYILVPVASFFSLGVGTRVYLCSEAKIRATLLRFTQARLAELRKEARPLLKGCAGDLAKREAARSLADLHDRVVAGGKYGSRAGAAISFALPLMLPVVGILNLWLD